MELEQQVVGLELARHLKELGVKQKSFFQWEVAFDKPVLIWRDYHQFSHYDTADVRQYYSAFTVAELGEMLRGENVSYEYRSKKWVCHWYSKVTGIGTGQQQHEIFKADTEADARAKMLIYLLENKLLSVSK